MLDDVESLSHTKRECKCPVVLTPKCRFRVCGTQAHLREVWQRLAEQRESRIEEGNPMPDHVSVLISIPSMNAVPQVIGHI
jgi:putative transposase